MRNDEEIKGFVSACRLQRHAVYCDPGAGESTVPSGEHLAEYLRGGADNGREDGAGVGRTV